MKHINMWEIIEQNDGEGQCGSYPGTNLESFQTHHRLLCISDCNNSNSNNNNNEKDYGNKNSSNNNNNNNFFFFFLKIVKLY